MALSKSILMKTTLLVSSIFLVSLYSNDSLARIYKWVDENGKTHYTQSPPPGDTESEQLEYGSKVDTDAAVKEMEDKKQKADNLQSERHKKAELAEKERKIAQQKEERCKQAKASLTSYQRPRVNRVNEDGSREVIGEEERLNSIENAEKQVEEACN
jgi:uncharacterized protein DUF4124